MSQPQVSIIIPTYNRETLIRDALDSVMVQTFQDFECIVVDDGSTDKTDEVIHNYSKTDGRVQYIRKENGGTASARNAGLDLAKGKYIQFLDSDDTLDIDKVEKQLKVFYANKNFKVSITNYRRFINEKGIFNPLEKGEWNNQISDNLLQDILFRWDHNFSIPIHTALFKADTLSNIRFDETLRGKEDWLFWVDVALYPENVITYIDEELASYRFHNSNKFDSNPILSDNYITVLFLIYEKIKNYPEANAFLGRMKRDLIDIQTSFFGELVSLKKLNEQQHFKLVSRGELLIKKLLRSLWS